MLGQQTMFIQFALPADCEEAIVGAQYDYQIKRLAVVSGPIWRRYDVVRTQLGNSAKIGVSNLAFNLPDDTFQKVSVSDDKKTTTPIHVQVSRRGDIDYVQAGRKLYGISESDFSLQELPLSAEDQ